MLLSHMLYNGVIISPIQKSESNTENFNPCINLVTDSLLKCPSRLSLEQRALCRLLVTVSDPAMSWLTLNSTRSWYDNELGILCEDIPSAASGARRCVIQLVTDPTRVRSLGPLVSGRSTTSLLALGSSGRGPLAVSGGCTCRSHTVQLLQLSDQWLFDRWTPAGGSTVFLQPSGFSRALQMHCKFYKKYDKWNYWQLN